MYSIVSEGSCSKLGRVSPLPSSVCTVGDIGSEGDVMVTVSLQGLLIEGMLEGEGDHAIPVIPLNAALISDSV